MGPILKIGEIADREVGGYKNHESVTGQF